MYLGGLVNATAGVMAIIMARSGVCATKYVDCVSLKSCRVQTSSYMRQQTSDVVEVATSTVTISEVSRPRCLNSVLPSELVVHSSWPLYPERAFSLISASKLIVRHACRDGLSCALLKPPGFIHCGRRVECANISPIHTRSTSFKAIGEAMGFLLATDFAPILYFTQFADIGGLHSHRLVAAQHICRKAGCAHFRQDMRRLCPVRQRPA